MQVWLNMTAFFAVMSFLFTFSKSLTVFLGVSESFLSIIPIIVIVFKVKNCPLCDRFRYFKKRFQASGRLKRDIIIRNRKVAHNSTSHLTSGIFHM